MTGPVDRVHIHVTTDRCELRHCGWTGGHFHWRHRRHRSAFDGSLTEQELTEFDAACAAQWPRPGRAVVTGPVADDALRGQLAEALADLHGYEPGTDLTGTTWLTQADALLRAVRAALDREATSAAAQELRDAAEAIDADRRVSEARHFGQAQRAVGEARSVVLERADALDAATREQG